MVKRIGLIILALILFSGCGLFKNRNASISKHKESKKTNIESNQRDSSFSFTNRFVTLHQIDSSGIWTNIQGEGITIKKDGSIHVEKGSVNHRTKQIIDTKLSDSLQESSSEIKDQSLKADQRSEVNEKVKEVESKPNLFILSIAVVIVVAGVVIYFVKRK